MLDDSARKSMNKSAIDLNQSESKLSIGDKTSPPLTKDGDGDQVPMSKDGSKLSLKEKMLLKQNLNANSASMLGSMTGGGGLGTLA
jgi:hypothetical protein